VRLNSVQLTNFRQHADTRIDFDLGLTGIIGPNGAGKSTVLEAIAWALYGHSAARGTRESIRFLRAGARSTVRVELDFELAGHRYRVVRGLSSAELYLDGGTEPIAATITGVSELMQRRLGMTRTEFFYTYFTGQKELNVMAAMSPVERAQFLSRVLGYDRLRTAQGLVRERRKLITAEIAGVRSAMPDESAVERLMADAQLRLRDALTRRAVSEKQRREADAAYAILAPRWDAAQRARDALQQLLGDLRVAENDEAARARDLERLEREVSALDAARRELERLAAELQPLNEILGEYRALEDLAREEGRRQALVEALRVIGDELTLLRERRAAIEHAPELEREMTGQPEARRREIEETTATLEAKRTNWVRDRQEAETKRDALRKQYQEVKAQRDHILDLGEHGVCPTCTRVLGENFRAVLDQLQEQLETIEVDGKYYRDRLEQLEQVPEDIRALDLRRRTLTNELAALERNLARAQIEVRELAQVSHDLGLKQQRFEATRRDLDAIPTGYDAARHAELGTRVAQLAPLNERAARLSAQIDREPELRRERDRVAGEVSQARLRVEGLRARYQETKFSEEDYARVRRDYEEAATAARAAEVAVTAAVADEQAARDAVRNADRAREEMERTREKFTRLEREKRLHEELDRAYTDLRTDLNFQLRPELSELASAFLGELTDDRYTELELDDQYNIIVMEEGTPKPVISGGEEDVSNLVLRLAISQMIAERAGQPFSLLVLDEVFGSLDETRRQNVVELLRRLQDRFEQVILITHIESVREELDHVILVNYDEQTGASRVRSVEPSTPALDELTAAAASMRGAGAGSL
jgi:exonuclease SbcC